MSITYAALPFVRPTGGPTGKLPLVLRNPINDNTKYDDVKDGVSPVMRVAQGDFRMWLEAVASNKAPISSSFFYVTSSDGYTWTKNATQPALSPNTSSWEGGVICPDSWFVDARVGEHRLYYHGASQIGLMTSPSGLVGTWTRYAGNPVVTAGGAGAWDEGELANAWVVQTSPNWYVMLFTGATAALTNKQIGLATSPDGITWTKYAGNPVLPIGSGNDAKAIHGGFGYIDELGRLHFWYAASDAGDVQRILYAYSDNQGITWTRNQADVISSASSGGDPDTGIGDMFNGWLDDGLITFIQQNENVSSYTGDALGALRGRGQYWLPRKPAATPVRPGRCFRPIIGSGRAYMTIPSGAKLLPEGTAFSLWMDFKMPPNDHTRFLYLEEADFDKEIQLNVGPDGKLNAIYRTSSGFAGVTGASRVDDNGWHRLLFRRTGAAAFSLYVDGASVGTSSVAAGSDATALIFFNIGGVDPAETNETTLTDRHGAGGVIRRVVTIGGYAMTDGEELTLWNAGDIGGPVPSGGTLKLNLRLGSGGAAGPDIDESSNKFSCTATSTELVVTDVLAPVPVRPGYANFPRSILARR